MSWRKCPLWSGFFYFSDFNLISVRYSKKKTPSDIPVKFLTVTLLVIQKLPVVQYSCSVFRNHDVFGSRPSLTGSRSDFSEIPDLDAEKKISS